MVKEMVNGNKYPPGRGSVSVSVSLSQLKFNESDDHETKTLSVVKTMREERLRRTPAWWN